MTLLLPILAVLSGTSARAQAPAPAPSGPALTRPPALSTFVEAPFPTSEAGRTGTVVLAITIAADGSVEDVTVQESAGAAFDDAAVAAARAFVFSPAEIDGLPARIRILYRYEFVERVEREVPTTAIFQGVVRDRVGKAPLPGVTVTLDDGRSAVTDDAGGFRFEDVPSGALGVTLEGPRLTALRTEETFVAGEQLATTYDVFLAEEGDEADDLEILVVAPTLRREAVSTEIPAEEARKVPGTQGDVLRVVESLPGVARASLGTGALVVWGAAPGDTGVYVDGVPVPRLYHDGGLRSVVGSEFVSSVALVPGGYGAGYGRGLGGLVTVRTRDFADAPHGAIAADLYDVSAGAGGPISERVRLGLSGRYGWVAPLLGSVAPDVQAFFPVPNYRDGQARLGFVLGPAASLDVTVLASSDRTRRAAPNPDPSRATAEEATLSFQRVSVRWTRDAGDGSVASAVLFAGADQASTVATFGATTTSLATRSVLGGARLAYRARVAEPLSIEVGLDGLVPRTLVERTGSVALPAREGDVRVFGQPPPDQIAADRFEVTQVDLAPYVEGDWSALDGRLHLVPGARFSPAFRSVSRAAPQLGVSPTRGLYAWEPHLEPRLQVRVEPSPSLGVTAAVGDYAQSPAPADLSASFGNPALPIARGRHALLGGVIRPVAPLSVEVIGFVTTARDLAMRSLAEQPAAARALEATGESRTVGVQSLVRLEPVRGVYGWVSYTLSRADRRDAPERPWRRSDYDQRHVLTALAGVELPAGFELGARGRVSTGFPRTEVVGAYVDARRDLYQPLFGAHNEIRLPTFFQADLRLARSFDLRTTTLDLSLEIQNLTDRRNVEEWVYSSDYTTRGAITGLPLLPVLGARWSF
jgi:TonB family protein